MRRVAVCFAVSAACVARLTLSAQSGQPAPQTTVRTGVDAVRLDVSVLDKNRRPVRGLTTTDFTVLEDGKPQPIVLFSAVDIPDAVDPPAAWMRDIGSDVATNELDTRRIVVIVMDDGMTDSSPGTAKIAKEIARNVIDRLGPNDLAAVVFTFLGRAQNFTTDHRQLRAAAETFIPKFDIPAHRMSAAARPPGAMSRAGEGIPLGCALRGRRGCLTDTLKNVASALQDTPPGRKTIVLVSSGVAYDFSMASLDAADDADDLRQTFQSLQRANINIYSFDPRGLTMEGIISARLDSLRMFAESTGGRAVVGTNTPWEHVNQVFHENSSYYLIGIQSTNIARDGRFRRLDVRVNRPDLDVRTRAGYFAAKTDKPKASKKPAVPVTALDKAFAAALPTGDLPLAVSVAPFAVPGRKQAALAIVIGTRRPVSNQRSTETLEVVASAFDVDIRQRGSHRQTVELTLRPTASGEQHFDLYSRLTLPPGRYEVRVGAESPGGAGSTFTAVDVPDFTKSGVALSGVVLGRAPSEVERSSDVLSDLVPIKPSTRREFDKSEPVTAFLRVYQGGKDPLTHVRVTARIMDSAPGTVFEEALTLSADRFRSDRSADYRLDVPLSRLVAGQYLLTIEAAGGRNTVSRDVRFRVR